MSTPPWRVWVIAARPATLPAAVVPVLVGGAAAASDGDFLVLPFAATLGAALLIQVGTNLANDLFDFQKGADLAPRSGPPRVTQSGLASARQVQLAMCLTFAAAALIGLYLVAVGGWPILVIGVLAIACGIAYTGGPWPLGYHGLGEIFVFVFFGPVAVLGTYYLQAARLGAVAWAAALPVGLMVTAILVVNNLRDIETDRQAGKRTLAVRAGARLTRAEYAALVVAPYAIVAALVLAAKLGSWSLLPWVTLPEALSLVRRVAAGAEGAALNPVLRRTAQLHLVFGALLAGSFLT